MKTEEELKEEVITYAYNLARGGDKDAQECFFLTGDWEKYQIDESKALLYLQALETFLMQTAQQVENAYAQGAHRNTITNAVKLFQYVFDRT